MEKLHYSLVLSWFAYVSENEECLLEDVLINPVRSTNTPTFDFFGQEKLDGHL